MTRRRNRLLVPQARQGVERLKTEVMNQALGTNIQEPGEVKMEVARQLDIPLQKEGNGELKAEDAGKIGGQIGGRMVKEMIRMAEESLKRNQ
ncbi:small, acid-soluble spore protein, alpha/beta type [Paenactinomyces guangxiensis]|uniref:Alpha/beta-type small acid-soluble spore protein n=1 Tax=Paenactinomyces guangxiensis TaxID=1490290 RepID=A0A7W1WMR8_9BACL|nr:alpha/beta-type small acid-soluble spore protein [Paenactinomyces guangxiensis]MBA4492759.1 alpha/beta-type small acid-soluble spore protein [Paenactinomyces guangxiensis]MBH8590392.1 alpha/beta-type small acid-soluble spore protein [Paenactinomyces guangxiensis]